jgi:hypothetical protein
MKKIIHHSFFALTYSDSSDAIVTLSFGNDRVDTGFLIPLPDLGVSSFKLFFTLAGDASIAACLSELFFFNTLSFSRVCLVPSEISLAKLTADVFRFNDRSGTDGLDVAVDRSVSFMVGGGRSVLHC